MGAEELAVLFVWIKWTGVLGVALGLAAGLVMSRAGSRNWTPQGGLWEAGKWAAVLSMSFVLVLRAI